MNTIHTVILQDPITREGIDAVLSAIRHDKSDCLLFDTGTHQFRSIADLKYLRETLEAHAACLSRYTKIALLHPEEYTSISDNPGHYQYFSYRFEAIAWLTT
ncbi:MAG: hypothetical protein GY801_32375 [bacterium]|nr:hypothetical protein [bacterium]